MDKALTVDLSTEHTGIKVTRWMYVVYLILSKGAFLMIGMWLGKFLIDDCLHSKDANPIVVTYLTLTSLACFINCGLPIEKLSSISLK